MVEVNWTQPAEDDLADIHRWVARSSPRIADAMIDRLVAASTRLADFPQSGRIVPEWQRPEVREIIVGRYRLIYHALPDEIEVLAVIDGARLLNTEDITQ